MTCKDQPFYFDTACKQAFNELKKRLVSTPLLIYFNLKQPLMLETDAFNGVIAGIFS